MTASPSPMPRRRLDPNKTYLVNHDLTFSEAGGPPVAQATPQPTPQPIVVVPPAPEPDPKAEAAAIKASWRAAAKASFLELVPETEQDDKATGSNAGWQSAIAKMNRQQGL